MKQKRFKIKYFKGNDILTKTYKKYFEKDAIAQFYLDNPNCDIISIEEVT